MNCPDCGNPVEKDAKFCPKCYARIEPTNLLQRVIAFFQDLTKPGAHTIISMKTTRFATMDKDGKRREYRTLDQVPPEMRVELEKLQAEVQKMSPEMLAKAQSEPGAILQSSFKVYKFKDANGQEHVVHSLDELPPNVKAAVQRLAGPAEPVMWRGKKVEVRAASVPRYLWSSASIDVYLDGERVFRTGGKIHPIGSHTEKVRIGGSEYKMEVSWGLSRNFRFPYQLKIDDELVASSEVTVENQNMIAIPAFIFFAVLVLIALGVYQLLKIWWPHLNGN